MKKGLSLGFILCAAAPIFGATNLDLQMSLQDKQQTGVVNLTLKQKQALASWIDQHYVLASSPPSSTPAPVETAPKAPAMQEKPSSSLSLNINLNNGQELILSDSTRWQVHPQDTAVSTVWIAPSALSVKPGTDPSYPFIITNLSSNQSVRARQVVPPTTLQAPSK